MKYLSDKLLHWGVLINYSMTVFLFLTQVALAGYQPPPGQKPPKGNSDSSGVRIKAAQNFPWF